MRLPRVLSWTAMVWTLLFSILLVLIPFCAVLYRGLQIESAALFWDPAILGVVRTTVWQAFLSTAISAGVGLPLGIWVGGSRVCQSLLALPYGVPTVIVGSAWVAWL